MSFARTILLIASLFYTAVTMGLETAKNSVKSQCVDKITSGADGR